MSRSRRLFSLGVFTRRTARTEMREELAFHLDARVARLVAQGMTPDDAREEALRKLGAPLATTEQTLGDSAALKERRLDVRDHWNDFIDDVRYALRGLARAPGFAAVAILTLAIGIGANTAIYSAVDALLLRSLPFPEPDRLTDIVQTTDNGGRQAWSYPKLAFFRDNQRSYATVAGHTAASVTMTETDPERIVIEEVTQEYLRTLGIAPTRGTDFPAEVVANPGAPKLTLIGDGLWQRRFGADPEIIGKTISLNGSAWQIVGVLPPGFRGLSGRADAIVNLTARPATSLSEAWSLEFSMVGRLHPGITQDAAAAEAKALGPRVYEAHPQQAGSLSTSEKPQNWSADARPLDAIRVAPGLRRALLVLFGAVALVLLIACANLANLLIARAMSRRREIAVRIAIGAGRARLMRLLITESVVLALLGGIAGLVIAYAGANALSAINPQATLSAQGLSGGIGVVGFENIQLDARALAFAFLVALAVGLTFGVLPAWRTTRVDLSSDLKDGSAAAGLGRRIGASRRSLVVAEIAIALVLLAGSGLMIRSLDRLLRVNPGFDGTDVLTLRVSVPPGVVAPDSMPGYYEQLQAALNGIPSVTDVALADCPPLSNGCNGTIMTLADRPPSPTGNPMVGVHWVTPNWFSTLRVPLKRGRMFTSADRLGNEKVVLINEATAAKYFAGEDPIGKRVAVYQGGFHTGAQIVGIVGDVRFGTIDSTARPDVYISYGQARLPRMMLFIRTTGDPAALAPAVRAAVRRFAPASPIFDVRTMDDRTASSTAQTRFSAVLLGLFAAVALSLAVMGIYGVMSFAVAQRTREIGIRMALGADKRRVLGLVFREGAMLAVAGVGIGLAAALVFTRMLRTMLFETATGDPPTYVAIVMTLALALLVAGWIPARRAAKLDPVVALRKG